MDNTGNFLKGFLIGSENRMKKSRLKLRCSKMGFLGACKNQR
jgi:hypothetical protein